MKKIDKTKQQKENAANKKFSQIIYILNLKKISFINLKNLNIYCY